MEYQSLVTGGSSKIILDESALTNRFPPGAQLVCHKVVGERVLAAIKALPARIRCENLFIHGPSGSGKSTIVKWAVERIREENRSIVCIFTNCWRYSTSMAIYAKIADAYGEPVSRRGRASDEIFDQIVALMKSSKRPILLVLDEIEALVKYDNARILDNIARIDEDRVLFKIIGISDNETVLSGLPQKTLELLRFAKIEVPSYTRDELFALLNERAGFGLRPGSYDNSLLEEIADMVAKTRGSGRFALDMLWRAARSSEDRGLNVVSTEEIERVKREKEFGGAGFSREERIIINLLKGTPRTSSELYGLFWQKNPRSKRQIRNYLLAMAQKKIIELETIMIGNRPKHTLIRLRGD